jgi:hypothetical protein
LLSGKENSSNFNLLFGSEVGRPEKPSNSSGGAAGIPPSRAA